MIEWHLRHPEIGEETAIGITRNREGFQIERIKLIK